VAERIAPQPVPKPTKAARPTRKSAKKYGKDVERQVVRVLKDNGVPAQRIWGSGADKSGLLEETDITAEWFLTEVKARDVSPLSANAKSINLADLDKARAEGKKYGKPAVLVFQRKGTTDRVVVVELEDFARLMGRAMQAEKAAKER
jgi:Holliday junction resolvase